MDQPETKRLCGEVFAKVTYPGHLRKLLEGVENLLSESVCGVEVVLSDVFPN